MGKMINSKNGFVVFLKPTHLFGRDAATADTILVSPCCSRLQSVLTYQDNSWMIADKSKNGTFLAGKPLTRDTQLAIGDVINFSEDENDSWIFVDASEPRPFLIRDDKKQYIELSSLNLLPSNTQPELSLSCIDDKWIVERDNDVEPIHSGSVIIFDNQIWHFFPNEIMDETLLGMPNREKALSTEIYFYVSLNEENIQILLTTGKEQKNCGEKAHHELLLYLARQRVAHSHGDLPLSEQGWISTELLLMQMRIDENHLNILIYRSRKMLQENGAKDIRIERRKGEIRLNSRRIIIQKGNDKQEFIGH